MPIFKTGSLLSAPGIKIVTASSFLTSEGKTLYGERFGEGSESQGPRNRRDIRKDDS